MSILSRVTRLLNRGAAAGWYDIIQVRREQKLQKKNSKQRRPGFEGKSGSL